MEEIRDRCDLRHDAIPCLVEPVRLGDAGTDSGGRLL